MFILLIYFNHIGKDNIWEQSLNCFSVYNVKVMSQAMVLLLLLIIGGNYSVAWVVATLMGDLFYFVSL